MTDCHENAFARSIGIDQTWTIAQIVAHPTPTWEAAFANASAELNNISLTLDREQQYYPLKKDSLTVDEYLKLHDQALA